MEKIIKIGGQDILLRSNARNLTVYRDEFNEDYFIASKMVQEIYVPVLDENGKPKKKNGQFLFNVDSSKLDSLRLARLVWTMAKTANKDLTGFEDWLDTLDSFPILIVFKDVAELINVNLTSITDIKNAEAAGN
jgi:hypothetical protein